MKEKRVKKLILKKEEIVNLSEYQMKSIQGGITTSAACVKSFLETVSYGYISEMDKKPRRRLGL